MANQVELQLQRGGLTLHIFLYSYLLDFNQIGGSFSIEINWQTNCYTLVGITVVFNWLSQLIHSSILSKQYGCNSKASTFSQYCFSGKIKGLLHKHQRIVCQPKMHHFRPAYRGSFQYFFTPKPLTTRPQVYVISPKLVIISDMPTPQTTKL